MSIDLEIQEELDRKVAAVLTNSRLARGDFSSMSPFFSAFLAYPMPGLSPFTQLVDRAQQEGLLYGTVAVPEAEYDNDTSYISVLSSVVRAISDSCPYLLEGMSEPLPMRYTSLLHKEVVLDLLPLVESRYRNLKAEYTEYELRGLRITGRQCLEYAKRFYYLRAILLAFLDEEEERAGALCGLLSPTENVGEWKKVVVQRALHGE